MPSAQQCRAVHPRPSILRPRPCQANRAKRTQFPAAPGGRGRRGVGRGKNAQNEANSGGGFRCEVSSVKQIVRNEPNSQRHRVGEAAGARDEGKMCKTNPIRRPPHRGRRDESCETNPIGRANSAKQSQFCPSGRTGKYFVEKYLWRIEHAGDLGKTKPIRAPAALGKGRQGCPRRWRDRVVQTKPICPGPTGRAAGPGPEMLPRTGTSVQNEANFRPGPTQSIWNTPRYAGRTRHAPICGVPLAAARYFGYKNGVFRSSDGPDEDRNLRMT
jgi:hypothetical protein